MSSSQAKMHKTVNHEIVSTTYILLYYVQSIMFIISSAISPLEKKPNKSTRELENGTFHR